MKIALPNKEIAYIDREDVHLLSSFSWHKVNGYVQAEIGSRKNGTRKHIRLHRLIMDAKEGQLIDHINRNKLDCRKKNLRVANKSENGMNRPAQVNNSSGFKGVSFHKQTNKWRSYITKNKRTIHLGLFDTPLRAYEEYKKAAIKIHKQFAFI